MERTLQAMSVDALRGLQWMLGGSKKSRRPESIAAKMFAVSASRNQAAESYSSGAEFDRAWKEVTGNG